jgi:hypothetical protein
MRLASTAIVAAAVAALVPVAASASDATTTRIETRAFYGATVTLEAGVRVFRPLPPHSKVIINPGGKTPVSLGFEENRIISHNYDYNYERAVEWSPEYGYAAGLIGDRHGRRHRPLKRGGAAFGHPSGGKH